MTKLDKILEIANDLNKKTRIFVPILENLVVCKNNVKNCIFIAKDNNGLMEQLFIDEPLNDKETIDERIMKIQNETNLHIKNINLKVFSKPYKEFSNSIFDFKIYLQDTIVDEKLIRQFDVFFEDKIFKDVYKLSLIGGPFYIDSNVQLLSNDSITDDLITTRLYNMLQQVLNNIKYNN